MQKLCNVIIGNLTGVTTDFVWASHSRGTIIKGPTSDSGRKQCGQLNQQRTRNPCRVRVIPNVKIASGVWDSGSPQQCNLTSASMKEGMHKYCTSAHLPCPFLALSNRSHFAAYKEGCCPFPLLILHSRAASFYQYFHHGWWTECIRTGIFYSKFPCPQRRW
jgi:hypothetical protein